MPEVIGSTGTVTEVPCSVLVVGAFKGPDGPALSADAAEIDAALDGKLANFLRGQGFKADVGNTLVMPSAEIAADSVAVVGLGDQDGAGVVDLRHAAGTSARSLDGARSIATTLHLIVSGGEAESAVVEGMLLGSYRFDLYKSRSPERKTEQIALVGASQEGVRRGTVRAAAIARARDLINEPASTINPTSLAERVRELAEENGLECAVLDEDDLTARRFGGLLGVGKGSDSPPRLIELHYAPGSSTRHVTLIGKGITFDSGGLSMKTPEQMEDMKTDMSGAAAVIGAMSGLKDLGVGIEVSGIIPSAENMVGGKAIKPGDVIRHYGGKTSEVLNTDAEGRLVLADALALASERKPDAIVDVATLTGAIVIALGLRAAGLFCDNDELRTSLLAAADAAGERFWWMPIFADYREQLESEVADIKNVATRWGGAIFAANFLREFVDPAIPWAHLDIAGSARAELDRFEVTKGGTGIATGTLMTWLEAQGA
ncbi:MAG: leucyl aminopeptidase [Actinomycetota bacterium]|nr:leucyl aminopeptidase [Actinomycetota bacterium]